MSVGALQLFVHRIVYSRRTPWIFGHVTLGKEHDVHSISSNDIIFPRSAKLRSSARPLRGATGRSQINVPFYFPFYTFSRLKGTFLILLALKGYD